MQWVATTEKEEASQGLLIWPVVLPLFAEPLRVVAKVGKLTHWCDARNVRPALLCSNDPPLALMTPAQSITFLVLN